MIRNKLALALVLASVLSTLAFPATAAPCEKSRSDIRDAIKIAKLDDADKAKAAMGKRLPEA